MLTEAANGDSFFVSKMQNCKHNTKNREPYVVSKIENYMQYFHHNAVYNLLAIAKFTDS